MQQQLDRGSANWNEIQSDRLSNRSGPGVLSGRALVKMVFWLPLSVFIAGMIWDLTMTFLDVNRAWDVARNVTQQVAVGAITHQEAVSQAERAFNKRYAPSASVRNTGKHDVTFSVLLTPQLGLFGVVAIAAMKPVNVSYTMRMQMR